MVRTRSTAAAVGAGGDGSVFVTVGTTKFDALIRAADNRQFIDLLAGKGYTSLVLQVGKGEYAPVSEFGREGETVAHPAGINVLWFRLRPSLAEHISGAGLVVSHAGAGSIFESLRAGRALVVVVNGALMGNHQSELASHLGSMGHLVCCNPEGLHRSIEELDVGALEPYEAGDAKAVAADIDALMGFS